MVEQVDTLVIGAGVVGLALARLLARSDREVVVLEEQDADEAGGGSATASRASSLVRLRRPVAHVFPTGHAVALTLEEGVEVLIHVGLDTVEMKGHGFETLVQTGDRVVAGMPLLRADLAAIRAAGHPTVTPVIVMNDPGARIELV